MACGRGLRKARAFPHSDRDSVELNLRGAAEPECDVPYAVVWQRPKGPAPTLGDFRFVMFVLFRCFGFGFAFHSFEARAALCFFGELL